MLKNNKEKFIYIFLPVIAIVIAIISIVGIIFATEKSEVHYEVISEESVSSGETSGDTSPNIVNTYTISGCKFSGSSVHLVVKGGASYNVQGCTFEHVERTEYDSSSLSIISVNGGTLNLEDCDITIQMNEHNYSASAIKVQNSGILTMSDDCNILSNSSACVDIDSSSKAVINDSTIKLEDPFYTSEPVIGSNGELTIGENVNIGNSVGGLGIYQYGTLNITGDYGLCEGSETMTNSIMATKINVSGSGVVDITNFSIQNFNASSSPLTITETPNITIRDTDFNAYTIWGLFVVPTGASLTFDKCSFTNFTNTAIINRGGNISINSCTIDNCDNNSVIRNESGTLNVSGNSIFKNCNATANGSIITLMGGVCTIDDTIFNENSGNYGGVIFNELNTTLTVSNSEFSLNAAAEQGGCIYARGDANFENVVFVGGNLNNQMFWEQFSGLDTKKGGAIANTGTSKLMVKNCEFKNLTSLNGGGAIYASSGTLTISDNSSFSGCFSTSNGGAIYTSAKAQISDSTFSNSNADVNGGHICHEYQELTILNSNFSNGKACGGGGGALASIKGAPLNIQNSKFSDNSAMFEGGAIYKTSGIMTLTDIDFIKNKIIDYNDPLLGGGAISCVGTLIISGGVFESNTLPSLEDMNNLGSGGAINFNGNLTLKDDVVFKSNFAPSYGGAIFAKSGSLLNITDASFEGNTSCGGAIYSQSTKVNSIVLNGVSFVGNNSGENPGGAIYSCGLFDWRNSTFSSNVSNLMGSNIFFDEIKVHSSSFTNEDFETIDMLRELTKSDNNIFLTPGKTFIADSDCSDVTISDYTIIVEKSNNSSSRTFKNINITNSPMIYIYTALVLNSCTFSNVGSIQGSGNIVFNDNNSISDCAIVSSQSFDVLGSNNLFENIDIPVDMTGISAVKIKSDGALTLKNCNISGGTQYAIENYGSLTVKSSTISGQRTSSAIRNNNGLLNITDNSKFVNISTTGTDSGGAIWSSGTMNLSHVTFENCQNGYGGAIYDTSLIPDNVSITNCTFTSNESYGGMGGAVFLDNAPLLPKYVDETNSYSSNIAAYGENVYVPNCELTLRSDTDIDSYNEAYNLACLDGVYLGELTYIINSGNLTTGATLRNKTFVNARLVITSNMTFDNVTITNPLEIQLIPCILAMNSCSIIGDSSDIPVLIIDGSSGLNMSSSNTLKNLMINQSGPIYSNGLGNKFEKVSFENINAENAVAIGSSSDASFIQSSFKNGNRSIYNNGSCSIVACEFEGVSAGTGGAIYNNGTLNISGLITTNIDSYIDGIYTTFTNCSSTASAGAIYNAGVAIIKDIRIRGCSANYGGAILNDGTFTINSSDFSDKAAFITECHSQNTGGAIQNNGSLKIEYIEISNCTAVGNGGAIHSVSGSKIDITLACSGNSSQDSGGAISLYNVKGIDSDNFVLNLRNSQFDPSINTAVNHGGTVLVGGGSKGTITANIVYNGDPTSATVSAKNGGAIFIGGKNADHDACQVTIQNSTFTGLVSSESGGAIANQGNLTLQNCKISYCQSLFGGAISNAVSVYKKSIISYPKVVGELYMSGNEINNCTSTYEYENTITGTNETIIETTRKSHGIINVGAIYLTGENDIENDICIARLDCSLFGTVQGSIALSGISSYQNNLNETDSDNTNNKLKISYVDANLNVSDLDNIGLGNMSITDISGAESKSNTSIDSTKINYYVYSDYQFVSMPNS